jgi:nucleotide-binding universal stress UspA family protein
MPEGGPIHRVLIAIDFTDAARAAFHTGVALAGQLGAELFFLHVVIPFRSFDFESKKYVETAETTEHVEEGVRRRLDELFREGDFEDSVQRRAQVVVRAGSRAAQEILDLARAENVDLIVIGSGHFGGEESTLGSTAGQVANQGRCSVLVVREPPG